MCPSCVGRRTWAFEQIEKKGRSLAEVAGCLHLRPERVERLVEQERDRRDRRLFKHASPARRGAVVHRATSSRAIRSSRAPRSRVA